MTSADSFSFREVIESAKYCEIDLGQDLVLFIKESGRFILLNLTSNYIWNGLKNGMNSEELVQYYSEDFGIDELKADADIQSFQRLFLLAKTPHSGGAENFTSLLKPRTTPVSDISNSRKLVLEIGCTHFELIMFSDYDYKLILENFGELITSESSEQANRILIERSGDAFRLLADSFEMGPFPVDELTWRISGCISAIIHQRGNFSLLIHASTIARGRDVIAFPAASGCGKSTLAALLRAEGFDYLGDEVFILRSFQNSVLPLPLPIAVKSGSWHYLSDLYPSLKTGREYRRTDGVIAKFIPAKLCLQSSENYKLRALVFPQFIKDHNLSLRKISTAAGLNLLATSGYSFSSEPNQMDGHDLIGWLSNLPLYELRYGDSQQASSVIRELFSNLDKHDSSTVF